MGNIENQKEGESNNRQYTSQKELMDKIHYIESLTDKMLGPIKIYRFRQAPYDYIMKEHKHFIKNNNAENVIKQTLQFYQKELQHKNIAKLHYYNVEEKYQMCNKTLQVSAYSNFYGITLQQVIVQHQNNDIRFTEQQIWYVIKALTEVYTFLNEKNYFLYQTFKPTQITLSAQGYIKLFPFNLNQDIPINKSNHPSYDEKNSIKTSTSFKKDETPKKQKYNVYITSLLYEKALQNRTNLWQMFPLPPQYLESIKEGNNQFASFRAINSIQKQQSFLIGMTILSMMIDQDIRKYYNYNLSSDQFCTYKCSTVWKDLGIIRRAYPKIYQVLNKILDPNPELRMSPKQILAFIQSNQDNISIGGSIRMFDDNSSKTNEKLSYRAPLEYDSQVLKGIETNLLESKLTAGPIKTFSKRPKSSSKENSQKEESLNTTTFKNIRNSLQINISPKTNKSRSIRLDTYRRESESSACQGINFRNKSNSLLQSSRQHPSMMSLDLDSQLHYRTKNDMPSFDKNCESRGQENVDTINITKNISEKTCIKAGVSLTSSKGSYQMKDSQMKHKQSKIKLNSRRGRGSSLALKINLG